MAVEGIPMDRGQGMAVPSKQGNKELFISLFLQEPFNPFILRSENLVDEIWSESRDLKTRFCSAGRLLPG